MNPQLTWLREEWRQLRSRVLLFTGADFEEARAAVELDQTDYVVVEDEGQRLLFVPYSRWTPKRAYTVSDCIQSLERLLASGAKLTMSVGLSRRWDHYQKARSQHGS